MKYPNAIEINGNAIEWNDLREIIGKPDGYPDLIPDDLLMKVMWLYSHAKDETQLMQVVRAFNLLHLQGLYDPTTDGIKEKGRVSAHETIQ